MIRISQLLLRTSVAALTLAATAEKAVAAPQDGQIIGGSAVINQSGIKTDIHQHSDKVILDWRSFDVTAQEHVEFHQPSSGAMALNRIRDVKASQIDGKLNANGHVVLINPNGVVFGSGSHVDVGSLTVTTSDIDNDDFMAGRYDFKHAGNSNGAIVNHGTITAKEAGLVTFVAPRTENHGIITAKLGKVQLAAADTFTLDMAGDGLLQIAVSDNNAQKLALNTGYLSAEGGMVRVEAATARNILDSLVENSGIIEAHSLSKQGGKIILGGGQSGITVNRGVLNASGRKNNTQGGQINVLGQHIAIAAGSLIDASGNADMPVLASQRDSASLSADKVVKTEDQFLSDTRRGGGSILIGGDYLGSGDTPQAQTLYIDENALTLNDALIHGDGGRTIFWSDNTTDFNGLVLSRGGIESGNGGFLETSGKINLRANGFADLSNTADGFEKGTYLLDPNDIYIFGDSSGTIGPNYVSTDGTTIDLASDLALWLDAADTSTIELTYSADELSAANASGALGTNTITTDIDVSDWLKVGSRIRLGASGLVTTADTLGADTYTITAIAGTTITVQQTLTSNYTNQTLNRGLVSQWNDKSAQGNNATQGSSVERPLFTSNGNIGQNAILTDGINDGMYINDLDDDLIIQQGIDSGLHVSTVWHSLNGGNFDWNGNATPGGNTFGLLGKDGVTNHTGAKSFSVGSYSGGNKDLFLRVNTETTGGAGNSLVTDPIFRGSYFNTDSIIDYTLTSDGVSNFTLKEYIAAQEVDNVSLTTDNPLDQNYKSGGNFVFGARDLGNDAFAPAQYSEMLAYSKELTTPERNLVSQYQSLKWGIDLDPTAGAGTEAAEAMDATNGFSAFSTRYLEKLSQTANIDLQATDTITLDLKGDVMHIAGGKSFSLTTTNSDIQSVSTGRINTSLGTGDITMISGGDINLTDLMLVAGNNSNIHLETGSGGTITTNRIINSGAGNLTLKADEIDIGAALIGNGNLQFTAADITKEIEVGSTNAAALNLTAAELGFLQDGWNEILIGDIAHENSITINEDINFTDNVYLRNSTAWNPTLTITANAKITTTDNANLTTRSGWSTSTYDDVNIAGDWLAYGGPGLNLLGNTNINIGRDFLINLANSSQYDANVTVGRDFYAFQHHNPILLKSGHTINAGRDLTLISRNITPRLTLEAGSALQAGGDILLETDRIVIDPTVTISGNADGSSDLTFISGNNNTAMEIGDGGAGYDWEMTSAEFGTIQNGFNTITFGSASMTEEIRFGANLSALSSDIFIKGGVVRLLDIDLGTGDFTTEAGIVGVNGSTILAGDITKNVAGHSTINLKGRRAIRGTSGSSIITNDGLLNVIFNADSDNNDLGYIDLTNTIISTRGGSFTAGGGLDPLNDSAHGDVDSVSDSGVSINGGSITTGAGNISIRGVGESTGDDNYGIYLNADLTTTTGDITLNGTGGSGGQKNYGVNIASSSVDITSSGGTIDITALGRGSSSFNYGIRNYGNIIGNGTSVININSTGGTGGTQNGGMRMDNNALIRAEDGNIMLDLFTPSTAGEGVLRFYNSATIETTGTGDITINTTNQGTANSHGIILSNGTSLIRTTGGGDITINHDKGTNGTNDVLHLWEQSDPASISQIGHANTGNITITGDTRLNMEDDSAAIIAGGNIDITVDDFVMADGATLQSGGVINIKSDRNININENITSNGTITLNADRDANQTGAIRVQNAIVTTNGGDFIAGGGLNPLTTAAYAVNDGTFDVGVHLLSTSINTGAGDISLRGVGEGTGVGNYGVYLQTSNLTTTQDGAITIDAESGRFSAGLYATGSTISVVDGDVNLSGEGTFAANSVGVHFSGSTISSTGTGIDAGTITLNGTATTSNGITLNSSSSISSIDGDIRLTGTSGGEKGIHILNKSSIISSGNGMNAAAIFLNGTGGAGAGNNYGIHIQGMGDGATTAPVAETRITTINGALSLTGNGGNTGSDNYGIFIEDEAILTSTGTGANAGTITLNGTGGDGDDNNYGVYITNAGTEITSIDGALSFTGLGGSNGMIGSDDNYGIYVADDADITSTGNGANAATITFDGTGGAGYDNNIGVNITGFGVTVTSDKGNIDITGRGGADAINGRNANHGVRNAIQAQINSIGTGADAATITVNGTAGQAVGYNNGVEMTGSSQFFSSYGDILIRGTGGTNNTASSTGNRGVRVSNGSHISSDGTLAGAANITVIGTGANSDDDNLGISVESTGNIRSVNGDMNIIGRGGSNGLIGSENNHGINLQTSGNITSSGTGAITLEGSSVANKGDGIHTETGTINLGGANASAFIITADSINFINLNSLQTAGNLTIQNRTSGTTIGLGGGAGTLNITDAELAQFTVGGDLTIGSANAGAMHIDSVDFTGITNNNINLLGGDVTIDGAVNAGASLSMIANGDITLNGSTSATGAGNSVVLAGRGFTNNNGAGAINAGAGRYLVYTDGPSVTTKNGLTAAHHYNRTYAQNPPASITQTGDLFLYEYQPILIITPDNITLNTFQPGFNDFTYTISGLEAGDSLSSAYSGMPLFTKTLRSQGTYDIFGANGTLQSTLGYGLEFAQGTLQMLSPSQQLNSTVEFQTQTADIWIGGTRTGGYVTENIMPTTKSNGKVSEQKQRAPIRTKNNILLSMSAEPDAGVRLIEAGFMEVEQPLIDFYDLCSYNVNYCQ